MRHELRRERSARGFTLIELMIVVAVMAVIALVAVPSYQDSVRKSRRADAVAALTRLQQAQERHRATNPQYASVFADFALPTPPNASEHYNLAIDEGTAARYVVRATAKASSPQFGDTRCRVLRVTAASGVLTYDSLDAANVVDSANVNANRCWAR